MEPDVSQLPGAAAVFPSDRYVERFQFSGSGAEYFRIWIVNLLLTIVTLGIYSAWAKVRRLRYFYGNTQLAGSSFEYHGQPMQILKGRLIAASVLIPYFVVATFLPPWEMLFVIAFVVATPFLVVKSRLFTSRMTSWRNIRFDFGGSYARAAGVFLGLMALTVVTLGLLFPYWTYARQRFLIGETRLGTTQFDFRARPGAYYAAVFIGSFIIFGAAFAIGLGFSAVMALIAGAMPEPVAIAGFDLAALIGLPPVLLAYLLGFAYMNARMRNAAFGNTHVGDHKLNCELQARQLFWLYLTNALAAVVSLGLLIPWAQVRLARYQLERMSLEVAGNLDELAGAQRAGVTAAGEEMGDLLDVDFGL